MSPMCQGQISFQKHEWAMETKIKLVRAFMPVLVTINFDDDWSKMNELAWRHHIPIISQWEIFQTSRKANSVVSGPIWPKFELVQDFMHVLITCKYKKDQIKNNRENGGDRDIQVQMCEICVTQRQVTPKWVVWFGPNSTSTEFLCLSWLPATLMMIRSKMKELAWRQHFPIISLREIF